MRKGLWIGTGGLSGAAGIKANSKKDRTAKALEKQNRLLAQSTGASPYQANRRVIDAHEAPDGKNTSSTLDELAKATALHEQGVIPDEQFFVLRESLLAQLARHTAATADEVDVVLRDFGKQKKLIVASISRITGLTREASKILVESAPCVILEGAKRSEARTAMSQLEKFGAEVEITTHSEQLTRDELLRSQVGGGPITVAEHKDEVARHRAERKAENARIKAEKKAEGILFAQAAANRDWLRKAREQDANVNPSDPDHQSVEGTEATDLGSRFDARGNPAINSLEDQNALPLPAAGWYTDPSRLFEHRYWDGTEWTRHVLSAGVQSVDQTEF
jgi:ribosomal protein L7/L12